MKRFWRLEGGRYWPETADPEMSALAPLLGDKQTSGERVRNDAIATQSSRSSQLTGGKEGIPSFFEESRPELRPNIDS